MAFLAQQQREGEDDVAVVVRDENPQGSIHRLFCPTGMLGTRALAVCNRAWNLL
jgi:hypothetical protein